MPLEKSAGAVIFSKTDKKVDERSFISPRRSAPVIEYLLLHYQVGHWDFPKGNIEKGEKLEETVKREVKEETGIEDIKFIPGFKESIKYFYKLKGRNIFKIVTFFLAETETKKVKISWEHIGFKWLPYQEAIAQLTFKNAKEILKKANDFPSKKSL
jgi:bis(5'-nucleosidyl)-tetraphosphatase